MQVIKSRKLSEKQKKSINDLLKELKLTDEFQESYYNQAPFLLEELTLSCFFLCYEKEVLISAILLYCNSREEAEVIGYTRKAYQRQGYFSALMKEVKKELKRFHILTFSFLVAPSQTDILACVKKQGASLVSKEYFLMDRRQREEENQKNLCEILRKSKEKIDFKITRTEDPEELCDILVCKFIVDDKMIGTASVALNGERYCIFAVEIEQERRGKGYGKLLMLLLLKELYYEKKEIVLQVSSNAEKAVSLYFSLGFEVLEQIDYYCGTI